MEITSNRIACGSNMNSAGRGRIAFSNDNSSSDQQHSTQFSGNAAGKIQSLSHPDIPSALTRTESEVIEGSAKSFSPTTFGALPPGSNNKGLGGRKRKRNGEKEMEKPREVLHVRAKRGQATDSHSLAERARREKINAKLRCLQELVPGCYKTMGMAVMLEVTLSYVHSLQNQIEFLSMKLSAASMFYDFNLSHLYAEKAVQERNENGLQAMETVGEEFGSSLSYLPDLTWNL